MDYLQTVESVRRVVAAWKREGLRVGLVPTMGFLHEGHVSLMRRAGEEADRVVVSIFVNPMQFGPNEDLAQYPRDLERDMALCAEAGVHAVFHPTPEEMYPPGFQTFIATPELASGLCGKSRPTHFQGVCTVVCKLFQMVQPEKAFFGQKDAQQLAIIKRMTADLNIPVTVVGCPIIREADGLAKSSRNAYLGEKERVAALVLHRSLDFAREEASAGLNDPALLLEKVRHFIESEPLAEVDYIELVDPDTMTPVQNLNKPALLAMAVRFGKARLLDNALIGKG
ncbi:pantoate--beta-alanine ligase [Desulfovibrio sp. OttesenSCG-928-G15]|nr:pantoate--beta-alanine ligase [Desulfovibrio sp. OttesenSCG-928-G15]